MQESDPEKSALFEEAADWWVRLDGAPNEKERLAFEAWLARSPCHRHAFADVCALWGELSGLTRYYRTAPITPAKRRFSKKLSQAAGLAAVAAMLWLLLPSPGWLFADYRTAAGQRQSFRLQDGSTVVLNGASALNVDWQQGQRQLHLIQGEVYFQVAPDKTRPFRVSTAHGTVTALGTAFDVRVGEASTLVAVTEHAVAVNAEDLASPTTVGENRQLEFDVHGAGPVLVADTDAITAWRRGRLVFQERPLGDVIAELNRHHRGRIWIADSAIASRQVNGVFHTNDPLGALAAIETALQLRSTHLGDYLILLHR